MNYGCLPQPLGTFCRNTGLSRISTECGVCGPFQPFIDSGQNDYVMSQSSGAVWVVEALDADHACTRWMLPTLSDDVVARCLGWIPEGLADINEELLAHLRQNHGVSLESSLYTQVIIGKEQA